MAAGAYYADVLDSIGRDVLAKLDGLPEGALNRHLPLPETNSLFALATHLAGSTEFWILQVAGGRDIGRNRPSEFRASGSYDDIRVRLEQMLSRVRQALEPLTSAQLDGPPAGGQDSRVAWRPAPETMTVRDCLLHAVEHAALHQGHIQLTRQMLVEGNNLLGSAG